MNPAKEYVVGVDGGGTKTHCALFDAAGEKVDLLPWGPTNYEVLPGGFSTLEKELRNMLDAVLQKNRVRPSEIKRCVFGLAGVDTVRQHQKISAIIQGMGVSEFVLCNDSFLGVKACCVQGFGVCSIHGTGCTAAGISPSGKMFQVGGQGSLTGDKGGGYYIGERVLAAIYNALFKGAPATRMTDLCFAQYQIPSKYEFAEVLSEGFASKKIKRDMLGRIAFSAANQDDATALDLLREIGEDIGRMIAGVIRELAMEKEPFLEIVLAGSIHVKGENPAAAEAVQREVQRNFPHTRFEFKKLVKPPVAGAVLWALEKFGKPDYGKVLEQF